MARPQRLPEDIAALRTAGITTVISLLEPAEAAKAGLDDEAGVCAAYGITFLNHPVRDMHLPDPAPFAAFTANIATQIRDGADVAVHCFASIGRSGMLTCSILGHFGYNATTALSHVSAERGVQVPDTPEQATFIRSVMSNRRA